MKGRFLRVGVSRYLVAILGIISLNFFLIHLMPGDPLVHLLGEETYGYLQAQKPQHLEALRVHYGIDGPLFGQYVTYLGHMLKGEFGWSYQYNRPVLEVILYRLKWTLLLLLPALCLSMVLGALLGCLSGGIRGRTVDRIVTPLLLAFYAIPVYCLAFLFLLFFAFHTGLAPLGGMTGPSEPGETGVSGIFDILEHMLLPLTVITLHTLAYYSIIMRNSVRQAWAENYVFNAMARGFGDRYILFRHILPNALLPFTTVAAMQFGFLFGGALLVEVVFSWQGMGTLMYEAVRARDYPLISGCFSVIAVCVVLANAAADTIYGLIDPRIKDGAAFH